MVKVYNEIAILTLTFFQYVVSIQIIEINNLDDLKVVPKLLETVRKYEKSDNLKYIPNAIQTINEINRKEKVKNKVLLKRIVPHDSDTDKYSYVKNKFDNYEPLFRIHKKIKSYKNNKGLLDEEDNKIDNYEKDKKIALKNVLQEFENKYDISKPHENEDSITEDEAWDGNRKVENSKNENIINSNVVYLIYIYNRRNPFKQRQNDELLRDPSDRLKGMMSKPKAYNKIIPLRSLYRAHLEKSGEENDPLAPGKHNVVDLYENSDNVWMPHYPPWNYWTYKKTVHQDVCPGNQVKVGNMCVWIPPH